MLILTRKTNESIVMGLEGEIKITIVDIRGDKVRLGIDCPSEIHVHRKEVYEAIPRENLRASGLERQTAQQPIAIEPKITPYEQFREKLDKEDYAEAGRIYSTQERNFEASHAELDKLTKGLYRLV